MVTATISETINISWYKSSVIETIKLIPVDCMSLETSPDNVFIWFFTFGKFGFLVISLTQFWVQYDKAEQHYQVYPTMIAMGRKERFLVPCINCVGVGCTGRYGCVWRYVDVWVVKCSEGVCVRACVCAGPVYYGMHAHVGIFVIMHSWVTTFHASASNCHSITTLGKLERVPCWSTYSAWD